MKDIAKDLDTLKKDIAKNPSILKDLDLETLKILFDDSTGVQRQLLSNIYSLKCKLLQEMESEKKQKAEAALTRLKSMEQEMESEKKQATVSTTQAAIEASKKRLSEYVNKNALKFYSFKELCNANAAETSNTIHKLMGNKRLLGKANILQYLIHSIIETSDLDEAKNNADGAVIFYKKDNDEHVYKRIIVFAKGWREFYQAGEKWSLILQKTHREGEADTQMDIRWTLAEIQKKCNGKVETISSK